MELLMFDKFMYKFLDKVDNFFSFIETYSVKLTSWLWNKRVKILKKKRKTKK
jgi:hypothetical protein